MPGSLAATANCEKGRSAERPPVAIHPSHSVGLLCHCMFSPRSAGDGQGVRPNLIPILHDEAMGVKQCPDPD